LKNLTSVAKWYHASNLPNGTYPSHIVHHHLNHISLLIVTGTFIILGIQTKHQHDASLAYHSMLMFITVLQALLTKHKLGNNWYHSYYEEMSQILDQM
jgi:hypothetical protein